jgi:protoporphyrin/coproporphyrin ferrochelatase
MDQRLPPIGVLLMAHGGPGSLDQIEPYLLDVRGCRPTSPELVEEIRKRYALIGGQSPLPEITHRQATALEARLNGEREQRFRVYVGMRYGQPRIEEAVAQMTREGVRHAVALVMAPHFSKMSTGAYFARLDEAVQNVAAGIEFRRIASWHDHPGFVGALAEKAAAALGRFGGDATSSLPKFVFTAHSLPVSSLAAGDPYDSQVRETATLLAARLDLPQDRWLLCYQSAGRSAEAWLGPQIEEVIVGLARAGEKRLLLVSIGFAADNAEVLYDIDIAGRELAEANGARLERSESLNASPAFIDALSDLVLAYLP